MKQFFKNVAIMLLLPFALCFISGLIQMLIVFLCSLPLWVVILILATIGAPILCIIPLGGFAIADEIVGPMVRDSISGKIMCAIGCAYAIFYNTTHLIEYIQEVNATGIENPKMHIIMQSIFGVLFVVVAISAAVQVFKYKKDQL